MTAIELRQALGDRRADDRAALVAPCPEAGSATEAGPALPLAFTPATVSPT